MLSNQKSKSPEVALAEAIEEVNLIDQALSMLPDDTALSGVLVELIATLRREHEALVNALEVHATQKDQLSKGAWGSLLSVLGTIPSWARIRSSLRLILSTLEKLQKRASAREDLANAIEELRQARQATRASLDLYNEILASEGRAAASVAGNGPVPTDFEATTNPRYQTAQGLASLNSAVHSLSPSLRTRIVVDKDYSHLSGLPAVEEIPNTTNRRSTDIPPPEPEPPYIPPNALSPPPRRPAYADSGFAQAVEPTLPLAEREPGARLGHTRGLSDLSAFNNANRSTSTFDSQGYAGSLSPGYGSSGSDLPRQVRAEGSVGDDSCGSSERLGGTEIVGHNARYQSETSSLEVPSRISQTSERSEGPQGGQ